MKARFVTGALTMVMVTGIMGGPVTSDRVSREVVNDFVTAKNPKTIPPPCEANCVAEVTLESDKSYTNPFMVVTLDAIVTAPDGQQLKVPAFWAGGNQWRIRYSSSVVGTHTYRTECSDAANPRLQGVDPKKSIWISHKKAQKAQRD